MGTVCYFRLIVSTNDVRTTAGYFQPIEVSYGRVRVPEVSAIFSLRLVNIKHFQCSKFFRRNIIHFIDASGAWESKLII